MKMIFFGQMPILVLIDPFIYADVFGLGLPDLQIGIIFALF
jgi:hypothetical protein